MTAADTPVDVTRSYLVGSLKFEIEIPGQVEVALPRESYPLAISGEPAAGWELIFQCPAQRVEAERRLVFWISAVLAGWTVPERAWRVLNVTPRGVAVDTAFGFLTNVTPRDDRPPIVWYASV